MGTNLIFDREEPSCVVDLPKTTPTKNIAFYRSALSQDLDPELFKAEPLRLLWYAVFGLGSLLSFLLIVRGHVSWPVKLLLGLILGYCNGTLGFICHELLHGSMIKNQRLQTFLSFFGAMPFFISPTFWRFWHNRLHHGKTQQLISDPDAFPNLRIYRSSRFMKFMFPFTPGSGHKRSLFYFFFWFSFHNFVAQVYLRFRNKIFKALDQKKVTVEFGLQILLAAALLAYAGPRNWIWVFLIPLCVQNYLLMSYIATNHNLSPLTSENDPLANSLSVTNHPVLEFLNLNFGYHIEHHIFPTMSSKHAKIVHERLKARFRETYQIMPKWKAIRALYSTPRIYKNSHQLIHPITLETSPTLSPKVDAPETRIFSESLSDSRQDGDMRTASE